MIMYYLSAVNYINYYLKINIFNEYLFRKNLILINY